jgi:DNA-binding HxlR family transcriptional regulator
MELSFSRWGAERVAPTLVKMVFFYNHNDVFFVRLPVMRSRYEDPHCGIAQALSQLGDAWTILILRNAFFGTRRFADFREQLGISKNVLSERLRSLVEHGIFERVDAGVHGERFEYRLTEKGDALLPVLTALREWADDWVFGEGDVPLIMTDRESGRPIPRLVVRDADGREVGRRDLRARPGPGARRG